MKYVIYRINCLTIPEEFYIGSSNKFTSRKSSHKKAHKNKRSKKYWCKLYLFIRSNGGWDNFEMVIIEDGELETKELILRKEQEYIDNLCPSLNSKRAIKAT
jgi:hypothetical protein